MKGLVLVDQHVEVLEPIGELLPDDKAGWDGDVRTRLAVERLWITAGYVAESHRSRRRARPVPSRTWSAT